jgi:RNA polymerase sigma-70 factor (ECF subfamily)
VDISEAQLIQQAKHGDSDAFAMLVALHERFVYNLAVRTLGNPEDAADVAQEAFVRAWQALPKFRAESQFRTWLYRIVLNLCLNRIPRLRHQLNEMTHDDLAEVPELGADPAIRLEQEEQNAFLHNEIDHLPESHRLLISLRYQGNLSYDEIANLVGLPVGTVKTGLFRAKARLRKALSVFQEQAV